VTCEDGLTGEVGATTRCELTAGDDRVGFTVTVDSVDDDKINYSIEVDDQMKP
jgi:hypothetical protein